MTRRRSDRPMVAVMLLGVVALNFGECRTRDDAVEMIFSFHSGHLIPSAGQFVR